LLAAIGIFGVISFSVSRRTREIGVRMALGATPASIRHLVIGESAKLVLFGLAAGIPAALILTHFLSALLFGVTPTDPLTFISVALLLMLVALAAAYLPARRAIRIDPMSRCAANKFRIGVAYLSLLSELQCSLCTQKATRGTPGDSHADPCDRRWIMGNPGIEFSNGAYRELKRSLTIGSIYISSKLPITGFSGKWMVGIARKKNSHIFFFRYCVSANLPEKSAFR